MDRNSSTIPQPGSPSFSLSRSSANSENASVVVEINTNPSESLMCRICHEGEEDGSLFSPCKCSGTMKYVHAECLDKWRALSRNPQSFFVCDNCKYQYNLYRPKLSKFLQSEVVISGITGVGMCALTLGSGTVIVALSGEKWELKNATFYGLIMIGIYGLVPKIRFLFHEVFQQHWYKFISADVLIPTTIALLAMGVYSTLTGVYSNVRSASRYFVKKLGERVLDVQ